VQVELPNFFLPQKLLVGYRHEARSRGANNNTKESLQTILQAEKDQQKAKADGFHLLHTNLQIHSTNTQLQQYLFFFFFQN